MEEFYSAVGLVVCAGVGMFCALAFLYMVTKAVTRQCKRLYRVLETRYEINTLKTLADKLAAEGKIRSK